MTAEEADARFEALVAQHRRDRKPSDRPASRFLGVTPMTVLVPVYVVGVVAGTFAVAKPLIAVFVGVPLLLICRAWLKRSGDTES